MFHPHTKCRACGSSELVPVLDLGVQPLANNFAPEGGKCAGYAPLKVLICLKCSLAQLSVVVRPEILYANYSYVTSTANTMAVHMVSLFEHIDAAVTHTINSNYKVLEVGSNTGDFLKVMSQFTCEILGIEPAKNLADIANARGIKTIDRLWGEPAAVELGATGYRADVIVARHVFAHIDDWKGFIHALDFVSHKDTLVVIEVPWVVDMFRAKSFDQVYHEHLSYVSLGAIHALLEPTPWSLSAVKHYTIHGGVIALMLRRKCILLGNCTLEEKDLRGQWENLAFNMAKMKRELSRVVDTGNQHQHKPGSVCGFGASAKATVWCNLCGFTRKDIAFVVDSTAQKQGKLVPGTDIPIYGEDMLMSGNITTAVNFAWNFHEEIAAKHKAFTDRGGKWVVPTQL